MPASDLLRDLIVTAEVCGHELSSPAAKVMAIELRTHDAQAVARALATVRRKHKGRLTLAAILEHVEAHDGRPGAEEAWAIAARAADEDNTVVWTREIELAYGDVSDLIVADDMVGARMAFREAYTRHVEEARERKEAVHWAACLGHDPKLREAPVRAAIERGRLPELALNLLPEGGMGRHRALPAPKSAADQFCPPPKEFLAAMAKMKSRTPRGTA